LKVALVFYGQPRFVDLPYSAFSHKWFLRKVSFEVLGHCWFTPNPSIMETSAWSGLGDTLRFLPDAKARILKSYPGANILFEAPLLQDESNSSPEYRNLLSHLTSLHRALLLLQEENKLKNYDLVVLSRFDAVILKFPDFSRLTRNKLLLTNEHDRFPDFLVAGSPEKILALDSLQILNDFAPDSYPPPAEVLKKQAFLNRFTESDLGILDGVSRPIRKSGIFSSISALIFEFLKLKVIQAYSRAKQNLEIARGSRD